jgi:hypothetical protein
MVIGAFPAPPMHVYRSTSPFFLGENNGQQDNNIRENHLDWAATFFHPVLAKPLTTTA